MTIHECPVCYGGYDYTKKLYPGMAVPVFYDIDNPKRSVAYCSTLHEVIT